VAPFSTSKSANWQRIQGNHGKQDEEFLSSTEFLYLEACHVPTEFQSSISQCRFQLAEQRLRMLRGLI